MLDITAKKLTESFYNLSYYLNMYTLMQIVVFLNTLHIPQITLLTHFEKLEQCEKKIYQAFDRYENSGIESTIKNDEDGKSYLELNLNKEKKISYMLCKKAIFYNE